MISRLTAICLLFLPLAAAAGELTLPSGARQLGDRVSPLDSYALPAGPFDGDEVPARMFEGRVERQTWRVDGAALTTLQMLDPLRAQIRDEGFDVLFECKDQACGGFDFRFGIEVVPAPDMHVDIRNFRFLSAVRGEDEALSILVSRSRSNAYIQVIRTAPVGMQPLRVTPKSRPMPAALPDPDSALIKTLQTQGHVVLGDLQFETGNAELGPGPYDSLVLLAAFLTDNPGYRIALVGHTDSIGTLDKNILLSRRRAEAVRQRMIDDLSMPPARIEAEGMGYLAPVASNMTPKGREANRRVEAILLFR